MKTLTSFRLKILGSIFMILNNVYVYIGMIDGIYIPIWFGYLGQLAAPIFFYLIVEGFFHTKDRKKYLSRIIYSAILMSYIDIKFRVHNNIFYSLALSIMLMMSIEALELTKNKISFRGFKIIIGIILICIVYILTEASIYGLLMTLIFYYLRNNKRCMFICYTLLSLIPLIAASFLDTDFLDAILKWDYQWMMIFGIIPILLYNGKLGVNNKYAKWIFYILYPLHLIILSIIRDIIKL